MKAIITTLVLVLVTLFSNAQTKYEKEMEKTFTEWDAVKTTEDFIKVNQHFDRISKVEKENWLPLYYSIFTQTLIAFGLEKDKAFSEVTSIEEKYNELIKLKDNSETLTLRGLFLTVKVAKDPMTYGQSLSPEIVKTYQKALELDPKNPRAMYLLAESNMGGAKFWGKDPKEYCEQIDKALEILATEKKENFEPKWGKERAEEVKKESCGK